jgi:hypothetical protein
MYSNEEAQLAVNKAELGRVLNRMNTEDIIGVLREHFNEEGRSQLSIGLLLEEENDGKAQGNVERRPTSGRSAEGGDHQDRDA